MQHLVTALTTSEKLVSNAQHVFNISSVTSGGNLYKHLFIQDMKINIKLRRNYQRVLGLQNCWLAVVRYRYLDLCMYKSINVYVI